MTKNQEQVSPEERANEHEDTLQEQESQKAVSVDSIQEETAEDEQTCTERTETPSLEEWEALCEELEETKTKSKEYLDGWQRSRAEFANYRRRQEQRQKQARVEIKTRLLTHLLPVLDDLERGFQAIPEKEQDNSWVKGLSLVGHKLQTALEKEGLSEMAVQPGDAFDPNYHEALTNEPSPEFDEGEIVHVVQRGYQLEDVVIRPALVRVSSGKVEEKE